jgi:hypothetical protein
MKSKTIFTVIAACAFALVASPSYAQAPTLPDPATEEANAVQATLLAKAPPLTNLERAFVLAVQRKIEGVSRENLINTAFYTLHAVHFPDKVAFNGTDPTAWTPQLIEAYPTAALGFINKPNCWNSTIASATYAKLKATGYASLTWRKAFKKHRRSLPLPTQIADTAAEADTLMDLTDRTSDQNLWLAELTLDLAALRVSNPNP